VLSELYASDEALARKRGFDSNTMGLKFPIWLAACSHQLFSVELTSPGDKEKETAFVKLHSLSDQDSRARSQHPQLKYLPFYLTRYLQNFEPDILPVIYTPPSKNSTIMPD
jgi:hypothetical protein